MADTFEDVLKILADNDGACLYWQLPDVKRALAAADACIVTLTDTDLLVHPDAIEIFPGISYTMKRGA